MADVVYSYLERMIPDLEQLQSFEVFSPAEIKAIVKKRNHFEYALKRMGSDKEDYLRYIQYEMNLNILQKKRKKRLGIMRLPESVEHHFAKWITMIFGRMLTKFGSDVTLWLQYIEYLKKIRNASTLNRVFAQAIQLHPTVEGLWIVAAGYEFEYNENITAARALMERALRLNPKSERLWIEFCKLECIYLARIKERMEEFGIDASALVPKGTSIDRTSLPDSKKEEGLSASAAGDPSTKAQAQAATTTQNPFLAGAIPLFIYRSAVKAIPDSAAFRVSFLRVFGSFDGTENIRQEIFDSLLKEFSDDARCVSLYAKHKMQDATDEEKPAAVLFALQTYEEALRTASSVELWEEYLEFCLDCLNSSAAKKDQTAAQRREVRAWAERVLEVCQKAEEAAATSELFYSTWIQTLLNLGRVDEAVKTAETATRRHAQSPSLWLLRIRLHIRRSAVASSEVLGADLKQLFAAAFDAVPVRDSLSLWGHYLELVLSANLSLDTTLQHFRKALVTLSGAPDKRGVSVIKEAFISRVAATHDIQSTRQAYEVGLDVPAQTEEYYRHCILIERAQRPMDLTVIRSLYRRGVRHHGKLSADLWLGWIEVEIDAGDFTAASNLFWEAQRMLRKNNTKLIAGYQQLRK